MTMEKECQGNYVDSSFSFAYIKFTGPATSHVKSFRSIIENFSQERNTIAVDAIGNIKIKIT